MSTSKEILAYARNTFHRGNAMTGASGPFFGSTKEISVVTAADASHTLATTDAGLVLVTAALAASSIIKLPSPSTANIGLYYKVVIVGQLAAAASIGLADASTGFLHGAIKVQKVTANYITGEANSVVIVANGSSHQLLDLDENLPAKGGAPGSVLEFYYTSATKVVVTGTLLVNHEDPTTGTSLVNATGWS
jgi:hypothetical protein